MSSFQDMSASGCDLTPLTATACLFAGGAESSEALGRFRSSILTVSSDGGTTVLASSLIRAVQATLGDSGRGSADHVMNRNKRRGTVDEGETEVRVRVESVV